VLGLALWLAVRRAEPRRAAFLLIGTVLLFAPNGYSWYFTWIVPLLCFFPSPAWLLLTVLQFLSYKIFINYRAFGDWQFDPLFQALNLDDRFISENEYWDGIVEHPVLINGPLVSTGTRAAVCRSKDAVKVFLGASSSKIAPPPPGRKSISPRLLQLMGGVVSALPVIEDAPAEKIEAPAVKPVPAKPDPVAPKKAKPVSGKPEKAVAPSTQPKTRMEKPAEKKAPEKKSAGKKPKAKPAAKPKKAVKAPTRKPVKKPGRSARK